MQTDFSLSTSSTRSSDPFLWGVSTSGYQSEGGYNGVTDPKNNWYYSEKHGHVMSTGNAADFWHRYEDDFQTCQRLGLNAFRLSLEWARIQPSVQPDRTTAPGFDWQALDDYSDRLAACRRNGLEPVVTLHHFTHPAWIGVDAWLSDETVDHYVEYVRVTITHINRRLVEVHHLPPIHWYITINEPNILVSNTYLTGQFPSHESWGVDPAIRAYNHLLAAHVRAYNCIHDIYEAEGWRTPRVSLNTYCSDLYWSEKVIWDLLSLRQKAVDQSDLPDYVNTKAAQLELALREAKIPFRRDLPYQFGRLVHQVGNWLGRRSFNVQQLSTFLRELTASPRQNVFDFIAIDYYDPFIAHIFRLPSFSDFEFKTKDLRSWFTSGITSKWWDWRSLPEGLHFFCKFYAEQLCNTPEGYRYPILIAENGMALRRKPDNSIATHRADQIRRSEFLKAHVQQVQRLLSEGIPLAGYMHWSLTDNYEWGSYTPRFGLFSIDFSKGSERMVEDHLGDRPSETYAQLIRQPVRVHRES